MSQVVKKPLSDNAKALMWTAVGVVAVVALMVVLYYAGMTGGTGGAG